ncbi:LicD family protein [uncultured Alteromonas sp.]|jgi:hypothetical protein|uniref:LicD family protein n=1 Tax=uncultured Alteromonas sp. TaxID=179113 RepID=UPI0030D9E941
MNYSLNKIYSQFANVHQVCKDALVVSEEANIDTILIGGSLLGMVRDKDFLPWDKDIDFGVYQNQIPAVWGLEEGLRGAGFECRKHCVGRRTSQALETGVEVLFSISQWLEEQNVEYVLTTGTLLSLFRDGQLHPEIDTLSLLIAPMNAVELKSLVASFDNVDGIFINFYQWVGKGVTIEKSGWRINLFNFSFSDGRGVWRDLNCEHWVDGDLLSQPKELKVNQKSFLIPSGSEDFLSARYGKGWESPAPPNFTYGRLPAFLQAYKDGVMVDYIIHYQVGDKTYWFEPNANVISTAGFIPTEIRQTTAGALRFPVKPEIFLQEHYGEWQTPVKTWNGAVDNPTLIPNAETMSLLLSHFDYPENMPPF